MGGRLRPARDPRLAVPGDPEPARQAAGPRPTLVDSAARAGAGRLFAAALLLVLGAQLAYAIRSDGLTHDEVLYVAAGRRHLAHRDFRVNPDQPPLAKMLAASGLTGMALRDDALAEGEDVLQWAYRFVHVDNDADAVITRSRVPVALVTLGLALLVALWARREHGAAAGLAALGLMAFHPSLLAHGHLATTDLPAAAGMVAAALAFQSWRRQPGAGRAALTGLALGAAVATRLTGWLLLPAFLAVGAWDAWRSPLERRARARAWGLLVLAAAPAALVVIWAAYGFRYAPWPETTVAVPPAGRLGIAGRVIAACESLRLLPEAYLEGARFQVVHGRGGHLAYLLGGFSHTGWRSYYAVALFVKSTPAFLAAVAAGAICAWRRRPWPQASPEALWLAVALVVLAAASLGRVDLGERYVLAVHPFLVLLAAAAVPQVMRWRHGAAIVALTVAAHAASALASAPRGYIAYFNVLAGGPDGGHRVLLDSNLDWGQDLPRLARWMRESGTPRVQLAYQGSDDPARWGIAREDAPGLHLYPPQPGPRTARVLAVSPDLLFGLSRPDDPYAPLRERPPDGRAGVFFLYRDPPEVRARELRP